METFVLVLMALMPVAGYDGPKRCYGLRND
jgi:hypothetical protein